MIRIQFLFLFFGLIGLAFAQKAQAYPNFISYGYQSCLSCHFNPYGNGPLTDYGRAVGSTAISDRLLYSAKTSEEDIANTSDFYFGLGGLAKKRSTIRPSASYRGLYLERNSDSKARETKYITMDASVALAMTFLKEKVVVVGQMAYAPEPLAMQNGDEDFKKYRTREHYVGYRVDKELGFYAGLMDKVYGLRVPDHEAYSRRLTMNNQNDQVHGVLGHYAVDPIELGVHLFVGNLVQDEQLRQRGVASQFEYTLDKFSRLGASIQSSVSDYQEISANAFHYRTGFGKGNSVMLELGRVKKKVETNPASSSYYLFLQNHLNFRRGLYGLVTLEAQQPDTEGRDLNFRFTPGLQWFPMPRIELRVEAMNSKKYDVNGPSDTWDTMAQVHLWF